MFRKRLIAAAVVLGEILVLLGHHRVSGADSPPPSVNSDVERRIDRVINGLRPVAVFKNMERYGPKVPLRERMDYYHTPGISIAVVNDYKVEWARGFGLKELRQPEPVTEKTLFQAASISKPIFALAVMRLVQERKLDLDEDVNRYLTSWKVPRNGSWQPRITLRQILSHTAGLTVHGFPGYAVAEDPSAGSQRYGCGSKTALIRPELRTWKA
jgi:CubicO group peptidase (beta-lactamase class C family)